MNQAHNDWAQVVIEGGLFALALVIVFLGWFAFRSWRIWTAGRGATAELLARCGFALIPLFLLSSAVDYPLRTPLLAGLMAIACCWLLPSSPGAGIEKAEQS